MFTPATMSTLLFLSTFIIGLLTFPILFYVQKLLKLPVPDLNKTVFHLHHSFYGLLLLLLGVAITLYRNQHGWLLIALGLGFIVHHEVSEPGLKGMQKFVYWKKSKKV